MKRSYENVIIIIIIATMRAIRWEAKINKLLSLTSGTTLQEGSEKKNQAGNNELIRD